MGRLLDRWGAAFPARMSMPVTCGKAAWTVAGLRHSLSIVEDYKHAHYVRSRGSLR